jgi:hypothetical protein
MNKSILIIFVLIVAFLSGCSFDFGNDDCIKVDTPMKNTETNECKVFPNPCDAPKSGWVNDDSCMNENEKSLESYVACGCGCCGGKDPIEKCLYRSKGDDINKIIEDDKKVAKSDSCALVGCSLGIKYLYCD